MATKTKQETSTLKYGYVGVELMRSNAHSQNLELFKRLTGGKTVVNAPASNQDPAKATGYQPARVVNYAWKG
jgi:hypothetical protein